MIGFMKLCFVFWTFLLYFLQGSKNRFGRKQKFDWQHFKKILIPVICQAALSFFSFLNEDLLL